MADPKKILALLKEIATNRIAVGIPAENANREHTEGKSSLNNATIAAIVNNGSPAQNIPPRPFMERGIKAASDLNKEYVADMLTAALLGDEAEVMRCREMIGQNTVNAIKLEMRDGSFTPLALSTIRARLRRTRNEETNAPLNKAERKAILAQEKKQRAEGNFNGVKNSKGDQLYRPLYDTGELAGKITYVTIDKNGD